MNHDPNQTNTNVAFSQHTSHGTQTNPFTGDLKGEFTSDFGTNTNAVSQIFKGGGFTEDKNKIIIIGVIVLAVLGGAFFYLTSSEDEEFDELATEESMEGEATEGEEATATEGATDEAVTGTEGEATTDATTEAVTEAPPMEAAPAAETMGNTGAFTIVSPHDGASQNYDETQGPAVFQWEGPADKIVFARNSAMSPIDRSVRLSGQNTYSFHHPHPGTWYWRVENAAGASEVRSFIVNAPERRNFPVSQPTAGGAIAGSGGVVSWQPGDKIARYQVQLAPQGSSWANPQYRFSTSGNSVQLQGVAPGAYDMRVGAFSEVSGRWEWQLISGVTVQ
jgi:hypothetical protein